MLSQWKWIHGRGRWWRIKKRKNTPVEGWKFVSRTQTVQHSLKHSCDTNNYGLSKSSPLRTYMAHWTRIQWSRGDWNSTRRRVHCSTGTRRLRVDNDICRGECVVWIGRCTPATDWPRVDGNGRGRRVHAATDGSRIDCDGWRRAVASVAADWAGVDGNGRGRRVHASANGSRINGDGRGRTVATNGSGVDWHGRWRAVGVPADWARINWSSITIRIGHFGLNYKCVLQKQVRRTTGGLRLEESMSQAIASSYSHWHCNGKRLLFYYLILMMVLTIRALNGTVVQKRLQWLLGWLWW